MSVLIIQIITTGSVVLGIDNLGFFFGLYTFRGLTYKLKSNTLVDARITIGKGIILSSEFEKKYET